MTDRHKFRIGVAIVFSALIGTGAPAQPEKTGGAAPIARVETNSGPVRGSINPTTVTYLGIPYAEAPVGSLRWRPAQPARPRREVLNASRFGDRCMQTSPVSDKSRESEDCLSLNIYVPRKSLPNGSGGNQPQRLPVIVWIHGGGNCCGSGDSYDPTPWVESGAGIIVVTLNYRLGVFGFLAHPALDAEGHAAVNYGILDQQLALKWVRANIARFGGDANNVTIMGESAGGLNVITHLVSPLSAGLFQRAIVLSGAYQLDTPSLAASEALGVTFADRIGCAKQTADCLRGLSAQKLMAEAVNFESAGFKAYNASTVDGKVIVETQRAALIAGRFNRVPVLQGNTSDESASSTSKTLTTAEHEQKLRTLSLAAGKDPTEALKLYSPQRYTGVYQAASAAAGDSRFACGTLEANRLLSKWVPTFAYEFADPAASSYGAAHGMELKYLFDVEYYSANPAIVHIAIAVSGSPDKLAPASQTLARHMREAWSHFAAFGSPKSDGLPEWPQAQKGIQLLNPASAVILPNAEFDERHHCAFWN